MTLHHKTASSIIVV